MKASPRIISLLFGCIALMVAAGLPGASVAQNGIVFRSLADLNKCIANHSDRADVCLEALQTYAKRHPKELFAIGKRARLQFKQWVALEFFEPALGSSPTTAKCADGDVRSAIVSGLAMPSDAAANAIARRLLNGKCFASLKTVVAHDIASENGEGYLSQHACPIFAKKGVNLSDCEPKKVVAAAPPVAEKLPLVNIATAKVGIIRVYSGPEGERITIADIPATPGVYLVRIDGVRSSINGKTMVHQTVDRSIMRVTYWTEIDGKRWDTFIATVRGRDSIYTLNIPGFRDSIEMRYNERESKAASADSLRK
ncbi:hypothetical protein [Chamaesiphon sp. VAR_69_metabat_338]|uniref:hypothetical protein n=1 Tax=Chamaesiphon sp. VAR_69_metabat_338 TaxID=2964704 RepID=UPI00286E4E34|nr:hypothetical protein [Chamaesiphon sp. VAR_69_metabat_338]